MSGADMYMLQYRY